jgi:predicted nucleic acid-binding Zn ribbon protein
LRRLAPRPIGAALEAAVGAARPAGLLAAVQSAWPDAAGPVLSAAATPLAEREGTVTVHCESAVWAQELEMLGPDLVGRLNERLASLAGGAEPGRVERLRFVVGSGANQGRAAVRGAPQR